MSNESSTPKGIGWGGTAFDTPVDPFAWKCNECSLTTNKADSKECASCATARPGSESDDDEDDANNAVLTISDEILSELVKDPATDLTGACRDLVSMLQSKQQKENKEPTSHPSPMKSPAQVFSPPSIGNNGGSGGVVAAPADETRFVFGAPAANGSAKKGFNFDASAFSFTAPHYSKRTTQQKGNTSGFPNGGSGFNFPGAATGSAIGDNGFQFGKLAGTDDVLAVSGAAAGNGGNRFIHEASPSSFKTTTKQPTSKPSPMATPKKSGVSHSRDLALFPKAPSDNPHESAIKRRLEGLGPAPASSQPKKRHRSTKIEMMKLDVNPKKKQARRRKQNCEANARSRAQAKHAMLLMQNESENAGALADAVGSLARAAESRQDVLASGHRSRGFSHLGAQEMIEGPDAGDESDDSSDMEE